MGFVRRLNQQSFMRKRRNRFRKSYPRMNSVASIAGKVLGLQKQVSLMKGMINSEKHYTDVEINAGAISTTGSVNLVNAIAQGDDVNNRNGNSVLHKYVYARGDIVLGAAATNTRVMCALIMDTANQGTTPAFTDIFREASVETVSNVDNTRRFTVLWRRQFNLTVSIGSIPFKIYTKTNVHCRYSGAASSDVLQNAIYFVYIGSEATNTPSVSTNIRNAFYDN